MTEKYSPQKHEWGTDASAKYAKRLTPGQGEKKEKKKITMDYFKFREGLDELVEGPQYRKRVPVNKNVRLNISGSRKGPGASLSFHSSNSTGLGATYNTKQGLTISLRGTGLRWQVGKGESRTKIAAKKRGNALQDSITKFLYTGRGGGAGNALLSIASRINPFESHSELEEIGKVIETAMQDPSQKNISLAAEEIKKGRKIIARWAKNRATGSYESFDSNKEWATDDYKTTKAIWGARSGEQASLYADKAFSELKDAMKELGYKGPSWLGMRGGDYTFVNLKSDRKGYFKVAWIQKDADNVEKSFKEAEKIFDESLKPRKPEVENPENKRYEEEMAIATSPETMSAIVEDYETLKSLLSGTKKQLASDTDQVFEFRKKVSEERRYSEGGKILSAVKDSEKILVVLQRMKDRIDSTESKLAETYSLIEKLINSPTNITPKKISEITGNLSDVLKSLTSIEEVVNERQLEFQKVRYYLDQKPIVVPEIDTSTTSPDWETQFKKTFDSKIKGSKEYLKVYLSKFPKDQFPDVHKQMEREGKNIISKMQALYTDKKIDVKLIPVRLDILQELLKTTLTSSDREESEKAASAEFVSTDMPFNIGAPKTKTILSRKTDSSKVESDNDSLSPEGKKSASEKEIEAKKQEKELQKTPKDASEEIERLSLEIMTTKSGLKNLKKYAESSAPEDRFRKFEKRGLIQSLNKTSKMLDKFERNLNKLQSKNQSNDPKTLKSLDKSWKKLQTINKRLSPSILNKAKKKGKIGSLVIFTVAFTITAISPGGTAAAAYGLLTSMFGPMLNTGMKRLLKKKDMSASEIEKAFNDELNEMAEDFDRELLSEDFFDIRTRLGERS